MSITGTKKQKHDPERLENPKHMSALFVILKCKKCGKRADGQGANPLLAHLDAATKLDGYACVKVE